MNEEQEQEEPRCSDHWIALGHPSGAANVARFQRRRINALMWSKSGLLSA